MVTAVSIKRTKSSFIYFSIYHEAFYTLTNAGSNLPKTKVFMFAMLTVANCCKKFNFDNGQGHQIQKNCNHKMKKDKDLSFIQL